MFVKICGVMDEEIAKEACLLGADYIGLLFSDRSQRKISIEKAKKIAKEVRGAGKEVIAVFVDESFETMQEIIQALDLQIIQLHEREVKRFSKQCKQRQLYRLEEGEEVPEHLCPSKDFLLFDQTPPIKTDFRFFIAGGLHAKNVEEEISLHLANGVDASRGVRTKEEIDAFISHAKSASFGGMYVPELLIAPLKELDDAFEKHRCDEEFLTLLSEYAGRPTPLTEIPNFSNAISGPRIFLKREDLLHTGAHKINNAIGQCLLAKKMGKKRIIAETGAGQHGVAVASASAFLGLECVVYMGMKDMQRQALNVFKMQLLGAKVVGVDTGSQTLKSAVNEALRDWAQSFETSHYCIGSALGPHPFPQMVEHFQKIIGKEAKEQIQNRIGKNPTHCIAPVGGGSNAIGLFSAFLEDEVTLIGVEAKGAARFQGGSPGVLHGSYSYVLQDEEGQILETHSISAGLDYPGVGPKHAKLFTQKRVQYEICSDEEALQAFFLLCKTEGIIPALESSHALGYLMRVAKDLPKDAVCLVNLSGRGDKDVTHIQSL